MYRQTLDIVNAAGLPAAVAEVVRLFGNELLDVRFPGLGHAAIEEALVAVAEHLERIDQAQGLLREREAELAECKERLMRTCERGLGYARLYAADDEILRKTVEGIPSLRPTAMARTRARRGRACANPTRVTEAAEPKTEQLPLERVPETPSEQMLQASSSVLPRDRAARA